MKKSSRPALKRLFLCFLLLYLLITLLPPLLYYYIPGPTASAPGQAVPEPTPGPALSPAPSQDPGVSSALPEPAAGPGSSDSFTLYDSATEKSLTVPAREFLMADLACEMDLQPPEGGGRGDSLRQREMAGLRARGGHEGALGRGL